MGSKARELSSCDAQASLLHALWDLPGAGIEPMSPALASGFLITGPQGSPVDVFLCEFFLCFEFRNTFHIYSVDIYLYFYNFAK